MIIDCSWALFGVFDQLINQQPHKKSSDWDSTGAKVQNMGFWACCVTGEMPDENKYQKEEKRKRKCGHCGMEGHDKRLCGKYWKEKVIVHSGKKSD